MIFFRVANLQHNNNSAAEINPYLSLLLFPQIPTLLAQIFQFFFQLFLVQ
jgi:hypothetical protein